MDILNKLRYSVSEKTGIPIEVISDTPKLELTGGRSLLIENHKGIKSLSDTSVTIRTSFGDICAAGNGITVREINKG